MIAPLSGSLCGLNPLQTYERTSGSSQSELMKEFHKTLHEVINLHEPYIRSFTLEGKGTK